MSRVASPPDFFQFLKARGYQEPDEEPRQETAQPAGDFEGFLKERGWEPEEAPPPAATIPESSPPPEHVWLRSQAKVLGEMPFQYREGQSLSRYVGSSRMTLGTPEQLRPQINERLQVAKHNWEAKFPDKPWTADLEGATRNWIFAHQAAEMITSPSSVAGNGEDLTAEGIPAGLRDLVLAAVHERAGERGLWKKTDPLTKFVGGMARGESTINKALFDWSKDTDTKQYARALMAARESADPLVNPQDPWYAQLPGKLGQTAPAVGLAAFGGLPGLVAGFGGPRARDTFQQKVDEGASQSEAWTAALTTGGTETALFYLNPFKFIKAIPANTLERLGGANTLLTRVLETGANLGLGIGRGSTLIGTNETLVDLEKGLTKSAFGRGDADFLGSIKKGWEAGVDSISVIGAFHLLGVPRGLAKEEMNLQKRYDAGGTLSRKEAADKGATWQEADSRKLRREFLGRFLETQKEAEQGPPEAEPGQERQQFTAPLFTDTARFGTEQQMPQAGPPNPTGEAGRPTPGAPPSSQPGPTVPPTTPEGTTTTTKAGVTAKRAERDEGPIPTPPPETVEGWHADAQRRIAEDPTLPNRLVEEQQAHPRPLEDWEQSVLNVHYRGLNTALDTASRRLVEAAKGGGVIETARAQQEADAILADVRATEEASAASGTEWGRSGVAKQAALKEDFSLARRLTEASIAKGGKPLTSAEHDKIEKLTTRIAELEAGRVKTDEENAARRVEEAAKAIQETPKPKRMPSKQKAEARQAVTDAWAEFRDAMKTAPSSLGVGLIPAAGKVVAAYVKLGIVNVHEFVAQIKQQFGEEVDERHEAVLRAAWEESRKLGDIPTKDINPADLEAVGRYAKQVHRAVVESGVRDQKQEVDAVHEELTQIVPDISRRQTMDAMSGYGDFKELDKSEVSVAVRKTKGELRELAKIDDLNKAIAIANKWLAEGVSEVEVGRRLSAQGLLPKKSGVERSETGDSVRQLIQQVNELKKQIPVPVKAKGTQLRTPLDSAKTATLNQIKDLQKEIDAREKKQRTELTPDKELIALRQRRDDLRKIHDEIFPTEAQKRAADKELDASLLGEWETEGGTVKQPSPRKTLTPEQRLARAADALDREAAWLEGDLKAGRLGIKPKSERLSSEALDAKRAKLDALRAQRDELRANDPAFQKSLEDRQTAAYKAALTKRLADYLERVANKDFAKKEVFKRVPDKEDEQKGYQIEEAKSELRNMAEVDRRARRTVVEKVTGLVPEALNTSRAILTSMDLSGVLRQGGISVASHPILGAKALPAMFRALLSKQGEFGAMEEIRNRPNARLYKQAKLAITESQRALSRQEEAYMGRWMKNVPGWADPGWQTKPLQQLATTPVRWGIKAVMASERSYVTFLNRIRVDVFDALAAKLGKRGTVTFDEARMIANFVNVTTGRGSLGGVEAAGNTLATYFFAPRYVASRFQFLLGQPLWKPLAKGNMRTTSLLAQEYAKALGGLAVFYGVFSLIRNLSDDNDPKKPTFDWNPLSSGFGKVRMGNTYIDPLSGLSQTAVVLNRIIQGVYETVSGKKGSIPKKKVPNEGITEYNLLSFVRSKLSPGIGAGVDIALGKNVVGEKVTPGSVATRMVAPLGLKDIYDTMLEQGIPKGTALSILTILGMGMQNYDAKKKRAKVGVR